MTDFYLYVCAECDQPINGEVLVAIDGRYVHHDCDSPDQEHADE